MHSDDRPDENYLGIPLTPMSPLTQHQPPPLTRGGTETLLHQSKANAEPSRAGNVPISHFPLADSYAPEVISYMYVYACGFVGE